MNDDWDQISPRKVTNVLLVLLVAVAGLLVLAGINLARSAEPQKSLLHATFVCLPWSVVKSTYALAYDERPIGGGVSLDGRGALQVLASPGGKTFSVFLILGTGLACSIAAGKDWDMRDAPVAQEAGNGL